MCSLVALDIGPIMTNIFLKGEIFYDKSIKSGRR